MAAQQLACASRSWYGGNFGRKGNRDTEPPTPTVLKCDDASQLHVTCFIVVHQLRPYGSSAASVRLAFVLWGNFGRKGNRDTGTWTPTVLKCNGTSLVACHILHNLHLLHPHGSSAASVRLAFVVWGELRQEGQSRHWTTDTDCVEMQRHIVSFCHMLHSRSFVAPMRQLSS